jgi:OOP family OmpA-OmpF porin
MKRDRIIVLIAVIFSLIIFSGVLTGCCCNRAGGMRVVDAVELKVEFDFNKADVRPAYHQRIKEVADYLKRHSDTDVVIEGHTDNKGSEEYNRNLSQRRANSVRRYLINKFGISSSRITAKGYGESKPIANNNTNQGRQRNRRVIAVFVK